MSFTNAEAEQLQNKLAAILGNVQLATAWLQNGLTTAALGKLEDAEEVTKELATAISKLSLDTQDKA